MFGAVICPRLSIDLEPAQFPESVARCAPCTFSLRKDETFDLERDLIEDGSVYLWDAVDVIKLLHRNPNIAR